MIKNILGLVVLVSSLSLHSVAMAEQKVAIFNLEGVLSAADYTREQAEALKKDENYKKLVETMTNLQKELEVLQKEGKTNGLTWSDEQKKQHLEKAQAKLGELKYLSNQQSSVRQKLQAQVNQKLNPEIEKIVNEIIEQKKIGLLLNAQAVYFYKPELDISEEVLEKLNKKK